MTDLESRVAIVQSGPYAGSTVRLIPEETKSLSNRGIITASYSEIDAYRQCPKKHELAFRQRWSKPKEPMSALGKGTVFHEVLAAHYRTLMTAQREWNNGAGEPNAHPDSWQRACLNVVGKYIGTLDNAEQRELMTWLYGGYVSHWWSEDINTYQVLAVEHTATIPLLEADGRKSRFRLKIKVDLILRDTLNGRIWIVDHKTASNLPQGKDFDFDEQFGLYQLGLERMGKSIFGLIYNCARSTRNKGDTPEAWSMYAKTGKLTRGMQPLEDRHMRRYMNRTKPELLMIEAEALATLKTAYSKSASTERHPDPDRCKWRCDFTEACLLGRRTGDNSRTVMMLQDTGYRQDFTRN